MPTGLICTGSLTYLVSLCSKTMYFEPYLLNSLAWLKSIAYGLLLYTALPRHNEPYKKTLPAKAVECRGKKGQQLWQSYLAFILGWYFCAMTFRGYRQLNLFIPKHFL